MKSIVFHGPSPTWCIASNHVWFDHPEVNKVECYSYSYVINELYKSKSYSSRHQYINNNNNNHDHNLNIDNINNYDNSNIYRKDMYDWDRFFDKKSSRICLRFSKEANYTSPDPKFPIK